MRCGQVKELLSAYLDAELATDEREQVALHLQYCSGCGEILTDFRRFDLLLANLPRVGPEYQQDVSSKPLKQHQKIASLLHELLDRSDRHELAHCTRTHQYRLHRPRHITTE